MSNQTPPTYQDSAPMPPDPTIYEPYQLEQAIYPQQNQLPPPPPYPSTQRRMQPVLRNWPWIVAIIAALMIGYGTGNYIGQATPPTVVVQPETTIQATPTTENPAQIVQPTPTTEDSTQAIPTSTPTTPPQIIQPTPATEDSAQVTPTSASTAPSQWVTTHTFSANGPKKTEYFTVSNEWQMQWNCPSPSSDLGQYNVIVVVYNADGTPLDPEAFNDICKTGVTSGTTYEHQGGSVYLDIDTGGSVTITVQELK